MDQGQTGKMPTARKSMSVVKVEPITMDFYAALQAIMAGEKVTKLDWADKEIYGWFSNDYVCNMHKV